MMIVEESAADHLLIGGTDEMTENLFSIMSRFGHWKRQKISSNTLFKNSSKGTLAGEGAVFYLFGSEKTSHSYARLIDVEMQTHIAQKDTLLKCVHRFLDRNNTPLHDIDLCFLGKSGDNRFDDVYSSLEHAVLKTGCPMTYKQFSGEYPTSTSFALWLAVNTLRHQIVPDYLEPESMLSKPIQKALIVNSLYSNFLSLILIEACH
jgi:hypothetical protein